MILTTYDRDQSGWQSGRRARNVASNGDSAGNSTVRRARREHPHEIQGIEDLARLENLVDAAFTAQSWEQLLTAK